MKLEKIKSLARQLLAACDEAGDEANGTAPEHDGGKDEGSVGDDLGEKSLAMKLSKYSNKG